MSKFLFVGWYPNNVDKYRNVFFQNLIFALADAGNDCTVISPVSVMKYKAKIRLIPKKTVNYTSHNNVVTVYYPRVCSASSKQIGTYNTENLSEYWFERGAIRVARKCVRFEQYDAVYGHFFLYGGLAAIKIGRILGIPSFVAFGECDYESQVKKTYGDLTKKDIEGLTGIISVSSKNAKTLDKLGIFKEIPILIAPNAVDLNLFKQLDKAECRKKLCLPAEKFIVGFVGGFIERKGDKRLLQAVNSLNEVYLAYAGTGDVPPSGERVLFCDKLDHNDIPILLNAVDVFCLPTLSEGSCNAVVEALACGVPVISSDLEFNDDVLDEDNSIRINPNSIDDIKNSIYEVKHNEQLRIKLSMKGIRTASSLSIETRARLIEDFIIGLLHRR